MAYQKIGSLKDVKAFGDYARHVVGNVPIDDAPIAGSASPLAESLTISDGKHSMEIGNRWAIHPMEGWDGEIDGNPSPHTLRRWRNFGLSGAKLIWGGEAVAVREDGRANPNQLLSNAHTVSGLEKLRTSLVDAHKERWATADGLVVGLQLTHSGRFSRPNDDSRLQPRAAFCHPILDRRFGVKPTMILTDSEIDGLIGDFVAAAVRARDVGYHFVDIKHCHGYLLHELLGAQTRDGRYGGSLKNRTRFLRSVVAGIRRDAPELMIGVRVSAFDTVPFRPDPDQNRGGRPGRGIPEDFSKALPYQFGFGVNRDDPTLPNLDEAEELLALLESLRIPLVNISCGSPYYNPHVQRPALYPPSDGYQPPEDPLVGVFRQLDTARRLKKRFPRLAVVGTGFSYLQDFLPHVAQAVVREGWMDFVGLGRMALSYWDLPGDCLDGKPLTKRRFCRTFSDCTTAPRNGMVSGCFPLDSYYAGLPEAAVLKDLKRD